MKNDFYRLAEEINVSPRRLSHENLNRLREEQLVKLYSRLLDLKLSNFSVEIIKEKRVYDLTHVTEIIFMEVTDNEETQNNTKLW